MNFNDLLSRNDIGCSTALFTKEIAKKYRFKADYYHEDYVFWLELLQNNYKAKGIKEVFMKYRVFEGTRSSDKMNSAKKRWMIYRKYLNFSFFKSVYWFSQYTFNGLKKYYSKF